MPKRRFSLVQKMTCTI